MEAPLLGLAKSIHEDWLLSLKQIGNQVTPLAPNRS